MVLYIRYTLYFIAYTSLRPYFASYATNSVPTFSSSLHDAVACRTRALLVSPRAQILCRWRTRSASDPASPLHSLPFLHFSLFPSLPAPSRDHLRPLPLPPPRPTPFFLSSPPPPRAFVGETFFRSITFIGWPPFIRAPGPRYYPLINCREKKIYKMSPAVCAQRRKIQIAGRNQFLGTCMRVPGRSPDELRV